MKSAVVLDHLAQLHPMGFGEWFFTREFSRLDGYAVRLYQGGGKDAYRRVAYEVKVAWSDFLAELRQPEKRKGALALSHQFYFAMPFELATKALARITMEVPEAGLIGIHEAPPEHARLSSPCVGAGYSPCVQLMRRAPIRRCRDWSMLEVTNMLRRQHSATEEVLTAQRDEARRQLSGKIDRLKEEEATSKAAHAALSELLAHTVEVGTEWKGPFYEKGFGRRYPAVGRVTGIERFEWSTDLDWPPRVSIRRVGPDGDLMDGHPFSRTVPMGEFLASFRRVEVVANVRAVG